MARVCVGSDHAGFNLKSVLRARLIELGHEVNDVGTPDLEHSVDYPDFGAAVAKSVVSGEADLGVVVCGSGNGIAMAANKVAGCRCGVAHDVTSARLAREHNDANVIAFGERFIGQQVALDALEAFLSARFDGGRHCQRVEKLNELDEK